MKVVLDRMEVWAGSSDNPVQLSEVEAWLHQAAETYNHAPLVIDPWQAVGMAQRLRARGYPHTGRISIVDMSEGERGLSGRHSADEHVAEFGLVFSLDDGEAASLAIALERGWVLASDDSDALRAMRKIRRNHPYQRIRKILIDAADQGIIRRPEANSIHDEMRRVGFWDTTPPFPREGT